MVYVLFDHRSPGIRVESILNQDRYVFVTYRIDGRRIHHLRTEVAKLHRFDVAQLLDGVCGLYDAWVGCHKAVHVGPYLKNVGVERCCDDGSGIVGTATTEVRDLVGVAVFAYKTRNKRNALQVAEGATHEAVGQFGVESVLMVLAHGLDELARVVPLCALHQCCHDVRAESLAVAHDGVLRLLREVVNEIHAEVDGAQLLEERVDDVEELLALAWVGDDGVYHLVVAFHHSLKLVLPRLVAFLCEH